jgi:hypothetical protein
VWLWIERGVFGIWIWDARVGRQGGEIDGRRICSKPIRFVVDDVQVRCTRGVLIRRGILMPYISNFTKISNSTGS